MDELMYRNSFADTYDIKLKNGHCIANCGVGEKWLTVYIIETENGFENQGECQKLLEKLREYCSANNKNLLLWCPLNEKINHICNKLNIKCVKD